MEVVFAHTAVRDKISFREKIFFDCYTSVGLNEMNIFELIFIFENLAKSDTVRLVDLYKKNGKFLINSKLITDIDYPITHIILTDINSSLKGDMTIYALSDDSDNNNLE